VPKQANFDLKQVVGTWYEVETFPVWYQKGESCSKQTYSLGNSTKVNGTVLNVSREVFSAKENATEITQGIVYSKNLSTPASLVFDYALKFWEIITIPFELKIDVVSTDYTTTLVGFSCQSWFIFHEQYAYIYSRNKSAANSTLMEAKGVLASSNVMIDKFKKVEQENC